jgi:hypothetical protein
VNEESKKPDFVMNPGEKTQMLFVQMVFQLSGLATMLMGKTPHPETGKTVRDLEAAQLMIDQLEMLETKTKGNLNREEEQLLRQTLMTLRMAYVEAVNQPASTQNSPDDEPGVAGSAPKEDTAPAADAESKKRYTKKY